MRSSTPLAAGAVLASALLLAACSGDGGGAGGETVTQAVTSEGGPAPADDTATAQDDTTSADAVDPQAQEDPVFAAIDAALDAYPGASVVDVDRDDGETFDIDLVVGDEQVELEISADGAVREDEREGDDDDVREAHAVTVSAADAIRQALDQHPGGVLDELELDEDDGALRWEIDLDDSQRGDLAELELPAT